MGKMSGELQTFHNVVRFHSMDAILLVVMILSFDVSSGGSGYLNYYRSLAKLLMAGMLVWYHIGYHIFYQVSMNMSAAFPKIKITWIIQEGVTFAASVLIFTIIIVLLGAPLSERIDDTIALAGLITVFTTMPFFCMWGWHFQSWVQTLFLYKPVQYFDFSTAMMALTSGIGCWLGAVPIVLDWDRPWQEWPITCIIGTVLGRLVGDILMICHATYHSHKKVKWT